MHEFSLSKAKRILCVGAHSDDIEIGCGGTLRNVPSILGKILLLVTIFLKFS